MSTTSLIVIQPSPFCNINCSYCYLPNRTDRTRMPIDRIAKIFERLFTFPTISGQVTVVWHAGEPLVLGIEYYEEAFARIQAICPKDLTIVHSFQTNGMFLNERWCDFIQRWDVQIGVSLDGPKHIHDAARRTRSGKGTFDQAMCGVSSLKARGIPFYVITVLTPAAFADPDGMFEFYREHDIQEVGFNIEELEGVHTTSNLAEGFDETAVTSFFGRFRDLMQQHSLGLIIRELEEVVNSVRHLDPAGPDNSLTTPFGIITVGVAGEVYTFSPELAGFSSPDFPTFSIGNLLNDSFADLSRSEVLSRMTSDIEAGVAKCRTECAYFAVCGGGAPSNKVFENGSFATSETLYCRLIKKRVTDFVLGTIEHVASLENVTDAHVGVGR